MKIWERFTCRAPQGARRYGQRSHGVLLMIFQPTRWMTSFASTFQPTRPLRGATWRPAQSSPLTRFQPTRPLRGATSGLLCRRDRFSQISTHAPLAGRDYCAPYSFDKSLISTHAPLAGRDCQQQSLAYTQMQISTHAPLAGRDFSCCFYVWCRC